MNLARVQLLSLVTKAITTALGIIQSVIIVRLLSPAEFGLTGLVMSIGGVIGVSQHLGIVDGAIREIAVRRDKQEMGHVFWVSLLVRQLITIPLSLGLLAAAHLIATRFYGRPEIVPYLQIFAGILILQGFQDVLGAALTGMKRFGSLYAVQVITAAINIAVFGYLTWQFGVRGFFWAIAATTAIMVVLLAGIIAQALRGYLSWPHWADMRQFGRNIIRIGAYMYVARIFYVVWQRLPLLVLGGVLAAEELGYLNVSFTFGSKLTIIAMALSEVNLAWMSTLFTERKESFERVVVQSMHRVLVIMTLLALGLLFFAPEILQYIIGSQYLPAEPLILLMTAAFFLYTLADIGTSSVFVAANRPALRAVVYGVMTTVTGIGIGLLWRMPDPFWASAAMLAGAVGAYGVMIVLAHRVFRLRLLTWQLAMFLLALAGSVAWLLEQPALQYRLVLFVLLVSYVGWETYRSKLLPMRLGRKREVTAKGVSIICFAGAPYDSEPWTNRQQVMSRVSERYPVLYIEPRVWVGRFVWRNWRQPRQIAAFLRRLLWWERVHPHLAIKAQWNLIPGSREVKAIAWFNHWLNRYSVLLTAWWLGLTRQPLCLWLYDTEAAEYLSLFRKAVVFYDCVDDHAAQAGVDRNPRRVAEEESAILARADVVTVTSRRLLADKRHGNPNTHLVLNAGDVTLFAHGSTLPIHWPLPPGKPVFGMVGALDGYKVDFQLLEQLARRKTEWQFFFLGAPVVEQKIDSIERLRRLPNVHLLGAVARAEVPAYVARFDVCLIPYRKSRYNASSFPLKFWEFAASGKPIVVSGLPELRQYQPLIGYAQTAVDFERLGMEWLHHPDEGQAERVGLARQHSWEKRVARLLELLQATIQERYESGR